MYYLILQNSSIWHSLVQWINIYDSRYAILEHYSRDNFITTILLTKQNKSQSFFAREEARFTTHELLSFILVNWSRVTSLQYKM
jgi:hypothetical protein